MTRARRPISLHLQLVLWLLPLHLLTTAAIGGAFYWSYGRIVYGFMDGQMKALAHSHAVRSCEGLSVPLQPTGPEVYEAGGFIVQLWCARDPARRASSWPALDVPLQAEPGWHTLSAGGEDWYAYTAPASDAGELRAQVLQSQAFRHQEVGGRAVLASLSGLLLLPVSLLVLGKVIGRTSRRLRGVALQLAKRDEHSTSDGALDVPCEITPLVGAFEALLGRLREGLLAQRRFVQDAAHELRTPLTALNLQLENLRPHMAGAQAEFEQLQQGMHRAEHLVEQMLSLSRQEAARTASASALLDLRALLRASIGQAMALADRRGVEVGFVDHVEGPLLLSAVEGDLRSLFDNLIDNALRHAPPGSEVELRLAAGEGGARWVDVLDRGPGLPASMRERVFDRFFRMPDAPAGGSGLGLAIARQAGLRHGLSIELRGREDGLSGLVARVHLPVPG
ncbi:sensor histidine kinase [Roseateles sp. P5_E7]